MPVQSLIRRAPVTVTPTTTIRAAAELMCEQSVSSVMIVERDHLFGLVTDRDLRNRVLACGLDSGRPIIDIATLAPLGVDQASPGFDALLKMARNNVHHMPVRDGQQAGSTPGPACYGRGGTRPTVTDAAVVLGYLDPTYFLGGAMPLDAGLARLAIADDIAKPLGIPLEEAAWAILDLATENMEIGRAHV